MSARTRFLSAMSWPVLWAALLCLVLFSDAPSGGPSHEAESPCGQVASR